jgi:hypothetical protein
MKNSSCGNVRPVAAPDRRQCEYCIRPHVLLPLLVCLLLTMRAADSPPVEIGEEAFEIAVIDKSLTGDWKEEAAFREHVEELFGKVEIRKFNYQSKEFKEWLDKKPQNVPRILCLVDGWTSPEIVRVDVRGSKDGKPLRATFEVKDRQWRDALRRAKEHADHPASP